VRSYREDSKGNPVRNAHLLETASSRTSGEKKEKTGTQRIHHTGERLNEESRSAVRAKLTSYRWKNRGSSGCRDAKRRAIAKKGKGRRTVESKERTANAGANILLLSREKPKLVSSRGDMGKLGMTKRRRRAYRRERTTEGKRQKEASS